MLNKNKSNAKRDAELIEACSANDLKKVKSLLKKGANASYISERKEETCRNRLCPLFIAISRRNGEIFKCLLEYGANINGEYFFYLSREPPLNLFHQAIPMFCQDISLFLLFSQQHDPKYYINESFKFYDSTGTALHKSIMDSNFEFAKALLEKGAEINKQHTIISGRSRKIIQKEIHLAISNCTQKGKFVELLLKHNADVNAQKISIQGERQGKETALFLALRQGNSNIVKMLLNKGANPNIEYTDGTQHRSTFFSTLYFSIKNKDQQMTRLLLSYGANINATTRNEADAIQERAIITAILAGDLQIVRDLAVAGADLNFKCEKHKYTVWEIRDNNDQMRKALLSDWQPKDFIFTIKPAKDAILSLMMIAKRQNWILVKPIMLHILTFVVYSWNGQM